VHFFGSSCGGAALVLIDHCRHSTFRPVNIGSFAKRNWNGIGLRAAHAFSSRS